MSVEHTALTARDSVLIDLVHFMVEYPGGIPDSECEPDGSILREVVQRYAEARLDRLVLEVKAAMPCQRAEWGEYADECTSEEVRDRESGDIELCISCLSRAKLAV